MAAVAGHVIEVLLCQFLHKRRRSTITNHAAGGTANANSSSLRNRRNVDTMCLYAKCQAQNSSRVKPTLKDLKHSGWKFLKEEVW